MIGWIANVAAGLLLGLAVLWFGPKTTVVCEDAGWPNSMFGDTFGHIDGGDLTGCTVPTVLAWALAGVAAVGPAFVLAVTRDRQNSFQRQHLTNH